MKKQMIHTTKKWLLIFPAIVFIIVFIFIAREMQVQTAVPIVTLVGESELVLDVFSSYHEEGATAYVGKGESVKVEVVSSTINVDVPGDYIVTYRAKNKRGKKPVEIIRHVMVVDKNIPIITLTGSPKMGILEGEIFTDPGVTAKDDVDGDLTANITVTSTLDISTVGDYRITYKVSDKGGNEATIERTVTVKRKPKPEPNEKTIYLTFDDGPSALTGSLLDVLKKHDVKATFFVVGRYIDSNKAMIKRAVAEGHSIGIHTYSHDYGGVYKSEQAFFADLEKTRAKIKEVTGVDTVLTRFPGGTSNTISKKFNAGIMTRLLSQVQNKGYYPFDWNISSQDATKTKYTGEQICQTLISSVEKIKTTNTLIALMHDSNSKKSTVDGIDLFIKYGKDHGYQFASITTDTPQIIQSPLN